jgi:hypothetical protein
MRKTALILVLLAMTITVQAKTIAEISGFSGGALT